MRLDPGSLDGVKFEVAVSERDVGRRVVNHEFPGRDDGTTEDLGKGTFPFTVEAIIIGRGYQNTLNDLIDVLESEGPYTLQHPYIKGSMRVSQVDGQTAHITESTREGGMARVRMTFIREGTPQVPVLDLDTEGLLDISVDFAIDKITLDDFTVTGPDFLTTAVNTILAGPRGLTNELAKINNAINAKFDLIDEVTGAIDDLSDEINTLLLTPQNLLVSVRGVINALFTAATSAGAIVQSYVPGRGDETKPVAAATAALSYAKALGTFGDSHPEPTGSSTAKTQERTNRNRLVDMVEALGTLEGARMIGQVPLDSSEQATALFDTVNDLVERIQTRGTIDGALDSALRSMRVRFQQHMRRRSTDLSGYGRYTPNVTTTALEVAWRLYGDAERAEEIVQRNGIEHPGLVAGQVQLAVASS